MRNDEMKRDVEQLLQAFAPAPSGIDRDRTMFLAGLCAATAELQPRSRIWPALSMISTAAALLMAVMLLQRPERTIVVERPIAAPPAPQGVPSPSQPVEAALEPEVPRRPSIDPAANYVLMRQRVLQEGLEVLVQTSPAEGGSSAATAAQRQLLEELSYGGELRKRRQADVRPSWWTQWINAGANL